MLACGYEIKTSCLPIRNVWFQTVESVGENGSWFSNKLGYVNKNE